MSARYDYSSWDGSQEFSHLDPEDLSEVLGDAIERVRHQCDLSQSHHGDQAARQSWKRLPDAANSASNGAGSKSAPH